MKEDISELKSKKSLKGKEVEKNKKSKSRSTVILDRLIKYYKKLFTPSVVTKSSKNFDNYSRLCQSFRQPIVLTKEEKSRIDTINPGAYTNFVEYGSDPNNQNYYICPHYWQLNDKLPLTKEQAESKKYGSIISKTNKKGDIWNFDDASIKFDSRYIF